MNIAQGVLPFQVIEDTTKVLITSFAGLPLVMETFRALGLPQSVQKHLPLHERPSKYEEADYVESFISVFAAGGDCFDDFQLLRQDAALQKLGLKVPSPESARFFVNAFHEEEALQGRVPHAAFIPEETEWLQGLENVNRDLIRKATLQDPSWQATIDIDASVIESDKREALYTYLGYRGYQPVLAYWAEPDLIVADQFRDGNVPAGTGLRGVLQKALRALPSTVRLVRLRSDSAAYVHELLDWCREEIPGRPRIEFAISADMTEELRAPIQALPEKVWKPLRKINEKGWVEGRKEWAEVEFVPTKPSRKKGMKPDRYLAIRIRPVQGELFADGNPYHYFAVVSNMWSWNGERLLRWQRERCGTVEKVIDVLKNDLATGRVPCKRFFADAAWFRLNVLAYNVLAVMKRQSLPFSWWTLRLKALRFHLLNLAGRVIVHGRRIYLKIAKGHPSFSLYQEARHRLLNFSSA
jgi:hypothetical protein